jgi:hypothetical protein
VATKKEKASTGAIQKLLDERRQIEHWLERLEKAADRTPTAVRDRVRGDYSSRLDAVVAELKGYESDLQTSLDDARSKHGDAKERERTATEELAEAELRFAVGEFTDGQWSEKKAGILDRLIRIREELGEAEEEIGELEGVIGQITAPSAPASVEEPEIAELEIEEPEPAKPAPPAPERPSLGAELGLRDLGKTGKREEPAPKRAAAAQQETFDDDLEFLKALGEDSAPSKPVGPVRRGPISGPVEKLADQEPIAKSRPSVINQRTLKCGECGALNLPTEWYCDRCGAELASL